MKTSMTQQDLHQQTHQGHRRLLSVYWCACLVILTMTLFLAGCGQQAASSHNGTESSPQASAQTISPDSLASTSWDDLVTQAKGSHVTFYGWGGDEARNQWLTEVFTPQLKEKYDITLDVVGMDIDDIMAKLANEKQGAQESGSIDMIWINGENFWSAKENKLLFGPFTSALPNMETYVNTADPETTHDFSVPIDGYESPYSKAQFVLISNTDKAPEPLNSAQDLLEFCKAHPGQVTYPAPPDFTGSAFVRTIIYDLCGYEQFQTMEPNKEKVTQAIQPALDYLNKLKPYLWNEGKTYPDSLPTLANMYSNGEVLMTMSYSPYVLATENAQVTFPKSSQTHVFTKGTIGNTNYIAIAQNAPHKAAALLAINEILNPQTQLSMYEHLKTLPVIDTNKLDAQEKAQFDKVDHGKGTLSQQELLDHRVPETPAQLVPLIEEIWTEHVGTNR